MVVCQFFSLGQTEKDKGKANEEGIKERRMDGGEESPRELERIDQQWKQVI
jgi:hypothetical protein